MGGTKHLRCLLMISRQLPLLACLVLLAASLVAVAAAATAPTRSPALWDGPTVSKASTTQAAGGASASGSFTLKPQWNTPHLQKQWSRHETFHSHHLTATNAKRGLSQTTPSGSSANVLPDYVYPLDSTVLRPGALPQSHLWYPLDMGKDLLGVFTSLENETEEAKRALNLCAFYSSYYDGACCTITSIDASVDGCMVVGVFPGVGIADGLHDWTDRLPAGVKVITLGQLNLTGSLPVSFGSAAASLERLDFMNNIFTGTLPQEWGALSSLKYIAVSLNPLLSLDMISPAWVMLPWRELSDQGGNVWSRLERLWVETDKVPAGAFSQGWLALDSETLVPVNGSGAGSPFTSLPGGDVEVPQGYVTRPFNLAYNLSVLTSMDRSSDAYAVARACQFYKTYTYLQEGACCVVNSYEATVDGCLVVLVWPRVKADGLHGWTNTLPAGVKVLDVSQLSLTGVLPVSFGNATNSLEWLDFSSNNFTRALPLEWGALSSIQSIRIHQNPMLLLDTMTSPAWGMLSWGQLSDQGGNLWSRLKRLSVETDKVPTAVFSQGWLALDNETLVPVNGSGAGSPFTSLPGGDVTLVPQGHFLRPFSLAYNLSVLSSMDRASDTYATAENCQLAKEDLGLQEGACCHIRSFEATVDGCTVVRVWSVAEVDGFHDWTPKLPAGVKLLFVGGQGLTGSLPVSFGNATTSLEQLHFYGNNFTGALPQEWAELPALRSVDVSRNNLTGTLPAAWSALSSLEDLWLGNVVGKQGIIKGANDFTGTLPSEWSRLSNLSWFACANGACAGLSGSIPETWAGLCKLVYFSFYEPANETSQLTGRLPWKWMYELSNNGRDEDIDKCFPDTVDIPSKVEFPRYVCLARGYPRITATAARAKSYRRNDGVWAYISNSTGMAPEGEAIDMVTTLESLLHFAYSFDVKQSACTSANRFTLIPVVHSVFGFLMLCALVVLLLPTRLLSCFVPAGGSRGRRCSLITRCSNTFLILWMVKHIRVILSVLKVGSVLADVGTDIYAAYLVGQTSFVWSYVTMLMLPNVVGAFVLHLNLAYFTKQQQQQHSGSAATSSMVQIPVCYPLYQWLYKKGSIGLLMLAAVLLVPYWLLCEIPMLMGAAIGHALGHVWQRFRSSWFTAPWLNLRHFLALLSLVMACTESPFVAVLFTYHYAQGLSYNFPVLITDWEFVLTVGFALVHIAWEFWAVVLSIKAGRFRKSIRGMFLGLLNLGTKAGDQGKGVASTASNAHADAELELGEGRMRFKSVKVGGGGSSEGPSPPGH